MPWNKVLSKFKAGTLKSGGTKKVVKRKQAIAIMLSEKRKAASGERPEYAALYGKAKKK
jgi:hypothetical protein